MKDVRLLGIEEILKLPKGSTACCAVKVWRTDHFGSPDWLVKDTGGLVMEVLLPQEEKSLYGKLFKQGSCLVLSGTFDQSKRKLVLCHAVALEDEGLLKSLEKVSICWRKYDFDPLQYTLCNHYDLLASYREKGIQPDDIFGQTVDSLLGERLSKNINFAGHLKNALTFNDWVHHEKKLLREFWEPGNAELFSCLDAPIYPDALRSHYGVTLEIEEAFRRECWEYYHSPNYCLDDKERESALVAASCEHIPGKNYNVDDDIFTSDEGTQRASSLSIRDSGQPFAGISEEPVFQEFEMAVVRAFGELVANDKDFCFTVLSALTDTTWQHGGAKKITYRREAAEMLVRWMVGDDAFQYANEDFYWWEIREPMRAQGWEWLDDINPSDNVAESHFKKDIYELFGKSAPRDKKLCKDIWATNTSVAWYNGQGESVGQLGGRGDGAWMASLCCRGYYLDWYCSDGGGVRQEILEALQSRGWRAWQFGARCSSVVVGGKKCYFKKNNGG